MPNPLPKLLEKYVGPAALPRARQFALGVAQDFWKDGPENPLGFIPGFGGKKTGSSAAAKAAPAPAAPAQTLWHAEPGEISEKMWGAGFVAPAGDAVTEMLITPLGLTKDMNVLDLSAGLGGRMRMATEKYGVYITGLEPDAGIAARGMEMSRRLGKGKHDAIAPYDPNNFLIEHSYDAIIARETFYRVTNLDKFLESLAAHTKPQAQVSFTDYIVNPEDRQRPAILAWQIFERGAKPLGLIETAQIWAKFGFTIRVHEDQTDFYKKEVQGGLRRFSEFLASSTKPDPETKKAMVRRVQTWAHRMAAMEQGMKFYRFYGVKR